MKVLIGLLQNTITFQKYYGRDVLYRQYSQTFLYDAVARSPRLCWTHA